MTDALDARVSALAGLSRPALIEEFRETFRKAPGRRASRELLSLAIAWRLQAQAQGGLPPDGRRQLKLIAADLAEGRRPATRATHRLKAGTRLLRSWHGETHTVTVLENAFEYRGARYGSLSEVARAITGTRWSGPAFFGLRKPEKPEHRP